MANSSVKLSHRDLHLIIAYSGASEGTVRKWAKGGELMPGVLDRITRAVDELISNGTCTELIRRADSSVEQTHP